MEIAALVEDILGSDLPVGVRAYDGSLAGYGWVTTRLGRTALASGTVQNTVERLAA